MSMNNGKSRARVLVSGRVQGVNFRYLTQKFALRYNVKGFVRNLDDGRVEAVFEGDKKDVDKMINFCKIGTSVAKIENVDVEWEDFKDEFDSFEIVY